MCKLHAALSKVSYAFSRFFYFGHQNFKLWWRRKKLLQVSCSHYFDTTYLRKPMNRHIFLPTPFRGTPTNSTLNSVLCIHHEAQSRNELLILVYNNVGTHAKPFPLPHSIRFQQLAPRTVLHMNFPTGTPNTLEVDLPWLDWFCIFSPWKIRNSFIDGSVQFFCTEKWLVGNNIGGST